MFSPRHDWRSRVEEHLRAEFRERPIGRNVDDYVADVTLHLGDLLRDTTLRVRLGQEEFLAMLADGQYRSAFELDRDRRWPTELPDRARLEAALWNDYSEDEKVSSPRPLYGYLLDLDESTLPSQSILVQQLAKYGDVTLRLSPRLFADTTFTFADSMATTGSGGHPKIGPAKRKEPHWCAGFYKGDNHNFDPLDIRALDNIPGIYVEAQIHRPIHTRDIVEAVVFGPVDTELKDALNHADIEWMEITS